MTDIPALRRILSECRTIAMVGLSATWYRPSYFAAKYLQEHGYHVIPVNPNHETILGERCYPDIDSISEPIDVVDVFQRSEAVPPFAEAAIRHQAKVLWMQLGVVNDVAAERARQAGIEVVMDRCMKIEHGRLYGGLNFLGVNTGIVSSQRPRWLP